MSSDQPPVHRLKPGTVTAVEVFIAVKAGLLLWAVGMTAVGFAYEILDPRDIGSGVDTAMITVLVIGTPLLVLCLAIALRIGRGREWARVTALVLESLSLAGGVVALLSGGYETTLVVIGLGLSFAAVCCAASRSARDFCRGR